MLTARSHFCPCFVISHFTIILLGARGNFDCGTPWRFEPPRDKTNKMACAPSEDSDQPGHPPSLIRVFAVRSVSS